MLFFSKLFVGLCLFAAIASAQLSPQPNVILIMTDDQGYGDFGIMGNEVLNTPHLDQLARESATMTEFYVSGHHSGCDGPRELSREPPVIASAPTTT